MKKSIARWLADSPGSLLRRGVSLVFPRACFAALMERQQGFDSCCTLSFDCDFPRDIEALPRLVSLLERYGYTASFACLGRWIRQFPDAHRALVASGHELVNHTDTHPNLYHPDYGYARQEGYRRERFNQISPLERQQEIERGHAACVEVLDCAPAGFRAPHFGNLHMEDVYPMLRALGYTFSSSVVAAASASGGTPFRTPEGIWEFPVSPCPAHPLGVFDSWHSLGKHRAAHARPGELAALFAELAGTVVRDGGYVNVYFDPRDSLESGELERVLQYLRRASLEVVGYGGLVERLEGAFCGKERIGE